MRTIKEILREAYRKYGDSMFLDSRRLSALLEDLLVDYPIEKKRLLVVIKENIVSDLIYEKQNQMISKNNMYANNLSDIYEMSANTALELVNCFYYAIYGYESKHTEQLQQTCSETKSLDEIQRLLNELLANTANTLSNTDEYLMSLIKKKQKPTKNECADFVSRGREYLKTGKRPDGVKFLKYASDHGYDDASLLLGYCYERGLGVSKDESVAAAFYHRAGISASAKKSYKFNGWRDEQFKRASAVAEDLYHQK